MVRNLSGSKVELYWIDEYSGDRALMSEDTGILHGTEFDLDSYAWHHFEVRELPSRVTGVCKIDTNCSTRTFVVNDGDHQSKDMECSVGCCLVGPCFLSFSRLFEFWGCGGRIDSAMIAMFSEQSFRKGINRSNADTNRPLCFLKLDTIECTQSNAHTHTHTCSFGISHFD